jgi:hypothetical protein
MAYAPSGSNRRRRGRRRRRGYIKPQKPTIRIVGVRAEIRTEHLPNADQKLYRIGQLAWSTILYLNTFTAPGEKYME